MALIMWDEKLKTNVKECDEQHKKLIALVNELHDGMKAGKGKDVIGKVLNELLNYTNYHFKTEEAYMQKYNFPEFLKHKREHEDLTRQAKELKERFDRGEVAITVNVMNFLKEWLQSHILGTDKKYGPFLNDKGVI